MQWCPIPWGPKRLHGSCTFMGHIVVKDINFRVHLVLKVSRGPQAVVAFEVQVANHGGRV